jgi:hypothetical protein
MLRSAVRDQVGERCGLVRSLERVPRHRHPLVRDDDDGVQGQADQDQREPVRPQVEHRERDQRDEGCVEEHHRCRAPDRDELQDNTHHGQPGAADRDGREVTERPAGKHAGNGRQDDGKHDQSHCLLLEDPFLSGGIGVPDRPL